MSTTEKPPPKDPASSVSVAEPPRLTPQIIEERLARGAKNAAALEERLDRLFVLRETSATLKLTRR